MVGVRVATAADVRSATPGRGERGMAALVLHAVSLEVRRRRRRRHPRTERIGQDDAASIDGGRGASVVRPGDARRHAISARCRADRSPAELAVVPQETVLDVRLQRARDRALMGRYPHLGTFEVEGPEDRAAAYAGARGDRHGRARRSAVQHAQRRRETARRDRVGAGAAGRGRDRAREGPGSEARSGPGAEAQRAKQRGHDGSGERPALGQGPLAVTKHRRLLLDEPTASLDLRYQFEVAALLQAAPRPSEA